VRKHETVLENANALFTKLAKNEAELLRGVVVL